MFMFLSHPLDPEGYAWPGEPVVKVKQCTDVSDDCPFCSFISEVPNHCGTHMDAPRHFVKDGLSINELPMSISAIRRWRCWRFRRDRQKVSIKKIWSHLQILYPKYLLR